MLKKREGFFRIYSSKFKSIVLSNIYANVFRGLFNILFYLVIIELTLPLITGNAYNFSMLIKYCIIYVVFIACYVSLSMWGQSRNYVEAYVISSDLRIKIGNKLRKLSLGYFKDNNPEKIASGILEQVQKSELIVSRSLPEIIAASIVPVMLIIFLASLNLKLAGIMIFSVILAGFFLQGSRIAIVRMGKKHMDSIEEVSLKILDYFKNIKLIKSYNLTGHKFESMKRSFTDLNKMTFKTETFAGIPMQIFLLCLELGYLLTFLYSFFLYSSGALTLTHLLAFAIIGYYFYEPVKVLGGLIVELGYASLSIKKIDELLNLKTPEFDKNISVPKSNDLVFRNVCFGYGKGDVLKGINTRFPEKSMTALVGTSGSGKSTMTNLIARFWDVDSGNISIGEISTKKIRPDDLLFKISMVFQDVFMFNDTIAKNIRIGKHGAIDEDVYKAAKLARCHDFIMKLPNGYDTVINEGGSSLSGGEKQRLSIARAILKNAPIVMFDEATASLDPENEYEIQLAIEELVKDKTIIMISHRFQSIENADNILVLNKGIIAEQGTHRELIQKKGIYHSLWKEQQEIKGWNME